MPRDLETDLAERGWAVVDLPDARPVFHARDRLAAHLGRLFPAWSISVPTTPW